MGGYTHSLRSVLSETAEWMCDVGRESVELYIYWSELDLANSARPTWDAQTYQLLDVLAAQRVFTDDTDVFINRETRSVAVRGAGLYIAVRDRGACTTIISVMVYYHVCPELVTSLSVFRRTPSGPHLTDVLPVHGACVDHAHSRPPHLKPTYLCTSTGSWYLYTGGTCHCEAGYQPNEGFTQCTAGEQYSLYTLDACTRPHSACRCEINSN